MALWSGAALADPAVGQLNAAGYRYRASCSGTLVAPDTVLTAAHCVARTEDGYLKRLEDMVFVADWNGQTHKGFAGVAKVVLHPGAFTGARRFDVGHDIAIVHLDAPLAVVPKPLAGPALPGPMTLIGYRYGAPHRQQRDEGCFGVAFQALWRLNCRVERGQSGGAVLDETGALVAVIVAVTQGDALVVPIDAWMRGQIAERRHGSGR